MTRLTLIWILLVGIASGAEKLAEPILAKGSHPDPELASKLNAIVSDADFKFVSGEWHSENEGSSTLTYRGTEAEMARMAASFRMLGLRVGTIIPWAKPKANTWQIMYSARNGRSITFAMPDRAVEKRLREAIRSSLVPESPLEVLAASFDKEFVSLTVKNTVLDLRILEG